MCYLNNFLEFNFELLVVLFSVSLCSYYISYLGIVVTLDITMNIGRYRYRYRYRDIHIHINIHIDMDIDILVEIEIEIYRQIITVY